MWTASRTKQRHTSKRNKVPSWKSTPELLERSDRSGASDSLFGKRRPEPRPLPLCRRKSATFRCAPAAMYGAGRTLSFPKSMFARGLSRLAVSNDQRDRPRLSILRGPVLRCFDSRTRLEQGYQRLFARGSSGTRRHSILNVVQELGVNLKFPRAGLLLGTLRRQRGVPLPRGPLLFQTGFGVPLHEIDQGTPRALVTDTEWQGLGQRWS